MPEDAIGMAGKEVRCTRCGECWYVRGVAATPDAMKLADLKAADVGATAQVAAPAPVGSKAMKFPSARAKAKPKPEPEPETLDIDAFGEHDVSDRRSVPRPDGAMAMRELEYQQRRGRRLRAISVIWMLAAMAMLAALLVAVLLRQTVVETNPGAAGVYEIFGMDVSPTGLEVLLTETRQVRVDSANYLIVSGTVENISTTERPTPMVELQLLNAGGDVLTSWSVDTGPNLLAPGDLRDFRTELPNPPVDAERLVFGLE